MPPVQINKKIHQHLYIQVLTAITLGVLLGHFQPEWAVTMKPLGDGFIKLIKMIIAPIIFCTVVTGIAGMQDMEKVGRVGIKALLYFEAVSTLALIIGLLVVHLIQPGAGMNVDASTLDTKNLTAYTAAAKTQGTVEFLLNIIPTSMVDAFAKGVILQVLLFSLLFRFFLGRNERYRSGSGVFHQQSGAGVVRYRRDHYEAGADRSIRGDVVYDRQVRCGVAGTVGETDGQLLPDLPVVHFYRTGTDRPFCRFQYCQVHCLYKGRTLHRAWYLILGIGIATHHDQTGKPGLFQIGSRPGNSNGLFIQPGRHLDLSRDGGRFCRASHQYTTDTDPGIDLAGSAACSPPKAPRV